MRTRPAPDHAEDLPPLRRSRWSRLHTAVAVLFLAALIAAAFVHLLVPAPDGPASPPGPAGPEPGGPDASVCGLPAGDQSVPDTTPAVTEWITVGTMAAPTAPDVGPGAVGGGVPYCYAHSPVGALYAGSTWLAVNTDPSARRAAATYLTAAGPGRDAMLAQMGRGVGGPGTSDLQLAGFSFQPNYAPEAASIDLALRYGTRYVHVVVALVWQAGDWKVAVPENGRPFDGITEIPDLTDYVPWSGR